MSRSLGLISQFLASEDGPTAAEYAAVLGLVTIALVLSISAASSTMSGTFSTVSSTLSAGS
jgi:pilus assembly protein Flp/PilA